jgi:hypothetical protein
MYYVTRISHRKKKHKFGKTCAEVLLVKSISVPPEQEIYCVDVSLPGHTRIHYVTHRSRGMEKHRFSVTCPGALFLCNTN